MNRNQKAIRRAGHCAGMGANRADLCRTATADLPDPPPLVDWPAINGCLCGPAEEGKRIVYCPTCGLDRLNPEARAILGIAPQVFVVDYPSTVYFDSANMKLGVYE